MKYTIIMIVRRINGISVGDNTQNQLQSITLHSFSTMNASCNNSTNDTPPFTALLPDDDSDIYITSPDKIDFCKRRRWDSNPRDLSVKRFSRPPRYDRFATSPNAHPSSGGTWVCYTYVIPRSQNITYDGLSGTRTQNLPVMSR